MTETDLARETNATLEQANPAVLAMLSALGRRLYYPARGIPAQAGQAKAKAQRCNATIGLATDGTTPLHLDCIDRYYRDLSPGEIYSYAPPAGKPDLRRTWQERIRGQTPSLGEQAISLPVVTNALTHGLTLIGDLLVDPGDEILLPDMYWENYRLCWADRQDARLATFPMFDAGLKGFDVDALAVALAERRGRKVVLCLNFPNNPTGYTPTRAEAAGIIKVIAGAAAAGTRLAVICDDAYYGMFYGQDCQGESLFGALAGLSENVLAVKIDGATKELFVWGLRVGFVTYGIKGGTPELYAALEQKTSGLIRGSISNVNHPGQSVVARALADPALCDQQAATVEILRRRYEVVAREVGRDDYADCWDAYPFNSGYFMCLRLKGVQAEAARQHLLERHGVGLIALGGADLRVAYSCVPEEQIPELFATIATGVRELGG